MPGQYDDYSDQLMGTSDIWARQILTDHDAVRNYIGIKMCQNKAEGLDLCI